MPGNVLLTNTVASLLNICSWHFSSEGELYSIKVHKYVGIVNYVGTQYIKILEQYCDLSKRKFQYRAVRVEELILTMTSWILIFYHKRNYFIDPEV